MPELDLDVLTKLADELTDGHHLTPSERAEVLRIATGAACKDSAYAANVSPETIRARRKRIYRKLAVPGAGELLSALLAAALRQLTSGAQQAQARVEPSGEARSA